MAHNLGRILFKKRHILVDGQRRPYMAPGKETRSCIQALLQRRRKYIHYRDIREQNYVFQDDDRKEVMKMCKDEYQATDEQLKLQKRDSWKVREAGKAGMTGKKGKGGKKGKEGKSGGASQPGKPGLGPNGVAVRNGKHSRFARHLQRVGGTMQLCELILFTGRVDPDFLTRGISGAPQPVDRGKEENSRLKRAAAEVKWRLRCARSLEKRIDRKGGDQGEQLDRRRGAHAP